MEQELNQVSDNALQELNGIFDEIIVKKIVDHSKENHTLLLKAIKEAKEKLETQEEIVELINLQDIIIGKFDHQKLTSMCGIETEGTIASVLTKILEKNHSLAEELKRVETLLSENTTKNNESLQHHASIIRESIKKTQDHVQLELEGLEDLWLGKLSIQERQIQDFEEWQKETQQILRSKIEEEGLQRRDQIENIQKNLQELHKDQMKLESMIQETQKQNIDTLKKWLKYFAIAQGLTWITIILFQII